MKYITRKPVPWFGPYHLFEPLEKLLIKLGKTEDQAYKIVDIIADKIPLKPFELLRALRCAFPWNKDVIKIDYWDTWSMDTTLAHIIVPMLKQLKETKHGIPADFAIVGGEEYSSQLCFDFYSKDVGRLFDEHAEKRWNEVLDKMIWSFEQKIKDSTTTETYWEPYWEDMTEGEQCSSDNIFAQMKMDNPRKKINCQKYDEYSEKLQEGYNLFGKYFQNLWD